jgi:hypothetical protein
MVSKLIINNAVLTYFYIFKHVQSVRIIYSDLKIIKRQNFIVIFFGLWSLHCLYHPTEHRDRVVRTPASYSEGPGFEYRPAEGYSEVYRDFPRLLYVNSRIVLKPFETRSSSK